MLSAGHFIVEKGLHMLVAAFERLLPTFSAVLFFIVGDGESANLLYAISRPGRAVVHPGFTMITYVGLCPR